MAKFKIKCKAAGNRNKIEISVLKKTTTHKVALSLPAVRNKAQRFQSSYLNTRSNTYKLNLTKKVKWQN